MRNNTNTLIIILFALIAISSCENADNLSQHSRNVSRPFVFDRVDSQIVNVTVNDPKLYADSISLSGEELLVGSDLFLNLCYDCHSSNRIFDTTGFYNTKHDLHNILLPATKNHGKWSVEVVNNLDSFDIAAIQYFIDRYSRNNSSR